MQIALVDLLKTKEISHPSVLENVQLFKSTLTARFRGWPWWKSGATGSDHTITFIFEEVSSGNLGLPSWYEGYIHDDEALEDFVVRPLADFPWAAPAKHAIYCASPLSEPLTLFVLVHDYLARADADIAPEDFLNGAAVLSKFQEITASSSYLIATVPEVLRDIICHELERQKVRHNVISHDLKPDTRLRVQFAGTRFLCARAFAEFD